MNQRTTMTAIGLLLLLIMANLSVRPAAEEPKKPLDDPSTDRAAIVDHAKLIESSGLAASIRQPGLFWSHNDSGGKTRLYAFDQSGKKTGTCHLLGAEAVDWEDMSSFRLGGKAQLLVADCGDNEFKRDSISLYVLDEPDPTKTTKTGDLKQLIVTYPAGPRDCEAIAVDSHRDQIILVAKSRLTAEIYTVPLTKTLRSMHPKVHVQANHVGQLMLPFISAMDVDPANGDIWIINYFKAFRFPCTIRDQAIGKQLSEMPKPVELPRWKQIEAIAVDGDNHVWVTSEGDPAPLGRLRVREKKR